MIIRKLIFYIALLSVSQSLFAAVISGNPKGNITVVEFYDYQCPHCRHMSASIDELIEHNPDLRVVYRMLPVLNDTSWFEASAVLAAENQGKFQAFRNALISQNEAPSSQDIMFFAKQAGLNTYQLQQDMRQPAIAHELNENLLAAKSMNIKNIPTFLIGRTRDSHPTFRFDGEVPYRVLQNAISQLKR